MPQGSPQRPKSNALESTPSSVTDSNSQTAAKPKIGCLTCRERHLKCDEAMPICQRCKKSKRQCKREKSLVTFQDDSRDTASKYKGDLERCSPLEQSPKRRKLSPPDQVEYQYNHGPAPVISHQQLPQQTYPSYTDAADHMYTNTNVQSFEDPIQRQIACNQSHPSHDRSMLVQPQPFLTDQLEMMYMKVFVEEVAVWMDSMDSEKHFSRLLPFQALRQPMLKHALLACGVRHLTLINSAYADKQAVKYYNLVTSALLDTLQNPDRDTVLCGTTATVLNVYEAMSERALQRMNHNAGARALIKECGWDANSTGIGAACFWLSIGLEIHSCLHLNWGVAWDPDTWGMDMSMSPQVIGGNEESWTHKMLWILAKITKFRSSVPKFEEQSAHAEQLRLHQRHQQWLTLKGFCDKWDNCVPPTMHLMASLPADLSGSKSAFPEVWYIKRATVVARLFYHTAMALMGSVHPMAETNAQVEEEMLQLRTYHARQICGIVAHAKDRGVASVSISCLALAGKHLTIRREQEEVIDIFEKIEKEAGWRVDFINDSLRAKWGRTFQTPSDAGRSASSDGPLSSIEHGPNPATMSTIAPNVEENTLSDVHFLHRHAGDRPYQGSYVPLNLHHQQTVMLHEMVQGGMSVQGDTQGQIHAAMGGLYGYGSISAT